MKKFFINSFVSLFCLFVVSISLLQSSLETFQPVIGGVIIEQQSIDTDDDRDIESYQLKRP